MDRGLWCVIDVYVSSLDKACGELRLVPVGCSRGSIGFSLSFVAFKWRPPFTPVYSVCSKYTILYHERVLSSQYWYFKLLNS